MAKTAPERFTEIFQRDGAEVRCAVNAPLALNDPTGVWQVETGPLYVFSVDIADGAPAGPRTHLFTLDRGDLLFGAPALAAGRRDRGLVATGSVETRLRRLPAAAYWETAHKHGFHEVAAEHFESWARRLSHAIRPAYTPHEFRNIAIGHEFAVPRGFVIRPHARAVWIKHVTGGSSYLGNSNLYFTAADGYLPLFRDTWLVAQDEENRLVAVTTAQYLAESPAPNVGLDQLYRMVIECVKLNVLEDYENEVAHLRSSLEEDRKAAGAALTQLASVLDADAVSFETMVAGEDPIFTACRLVGEQLGVTMRPPLRHGRDPIGDIAEASRLRTRLVTLSGKWWQEDCGPLVAEMQDGGAVVALLQRGIDGYELVDPSAGTRRTVTAEVAAGVHPLAYTFYRSLPDKPLKVLDVLRFCADSQHIGRDLGLILLMGLIGGLIGMVVPIATGQLIDYVLPDADLGELGGLCTGLFIASLTAALFQLTRGFALLRLETRMDNMLQSAVWDRILSLPATFFRQFTVGDLALRANSINSIRNMLSEATMSTVLSSVFSVFNFFLLFYYSSKLAILALVLIAIAMVMIVASNWLRLRFERQMLALSGRISGIVLQFINGIAKLRVANAEIRAFAVWAHQFAEQRRVTVKSETVANVFAVFNVGFTQLTTMAVFATIAFHLDPSTATTTGAAAAAAGAVTGGAVTGGAGLSIGDFMAFNAAFGQFLAAMLQLAQTGMQLLMIIPTWERARPILETMPEIDLTKKDPGILKGGIEINHVHFRYNPSTPIVLHDITIKAEPGEFIAVVGPSGAGKSTIMRLLLGFERPESGSIYFDGQDIKDLDLRRVRAQLGVVLQNGRVLAGDIFSNIVGASRLTLDDAWEAARMAGFDADINEMPMGMHTFVVEGGTTLSGGQRQRLLIARALVKKPKIIFFDEATSALDNRTQDIVSHSIDLLDSTRIVVAHRLSTIRHADRIYVLADGRVAQTGTFDELIKVDGLFKDIAQRQLL